MKGARDISPLGIRIPDYLKKRIQQEADKNGRSMNSEIV
ncbi:Arc family DNA-binding protein, partial [Escherichia coli]|nr:Arc family DNA-binding protein [Escherichia coli]